MKRLFQISALALALALPGSLMADDEKTRGPKNHEKEKRKLAGQLCVAAMASGAYGTLTPDELSDFCTHTAIHIIDADYTADP